MQVQANMVYIPDRCYSFIWLKFMPHCAIETIEIIKVPPVKTSLLTYDVKTRVRNSTVKWILNVARK